MSDPFAELDQLTAQSDWTGLLVRARQIAKARPDAWEPAYHVGRALLEDGAYKQADQHLLGCMDRFPGLPQFLVLYGFVGARSLAKSDAVARWEMLQPRLPNAPGLRVGLATAYRTSGQIDRAEQVLAEGIERLPHNLPMLIQYADLAAQRQDWHAAAARWAVVREKAPGRTDAVVALMAALRQAGRLDDAEALAQEALLDEPDNADLNTGAAAVAAARQDWPSAVARLQSVLQSAPDNLAAATGLVAALQHTGQADAADAALRAALERHPDNEVLLFEHARMATRAKNWNEAVERWALVHQRCGPRKAIYLGYAEALMQLDMPIEAEEIASEGIGFDRDDRDLLIQHAELATKRFDMKESQTRWMALRRKFPEDAGIMEGLQRARKTIAKDKIQERKDEAAMSLAVVRGTMRVVEKDKGPAHMPTSGPTALERLLTGLPATTSVPPPPPPPPPAPPAGKGLMNRLFGKK